MAIVKNITIDKYSSFEKMFSFSDKNKAPFNLTGYSANSQIKKYHNESVVAEFSCEILQPPTLGKVILRMDYLETANVEPGKYLYDVLLTSSTERLRAVEGTVEITLNITTR
jgi:hypothetical protein